MSVIMNINHYFEQKEKLYENTVLYIENEQFDYDFGYLINYFTSLEIKSNKEELTHLLGMIVSICNNYHRKDGFFDRIEQIIQYFEKDIRNMYKNSEIFNIFLSNKRLILFLLKKEVIKFDKYVYKIICEKTEPNGTRYCHYFLPEIKKIATKEQMKIIEDISLNESNIYDNYEEKRRIGENESYICSLIRNDSVEEFITYVNRTNLPLESKIKPSIFETNSFLNENQPTLIEYAAFFGSIQIVRYLKYNNVKLNPILWIYVTHSNNAEMVHFLEENQIEPPNKTYESFFLEAIKCHHNNIANYVENNLLDYNSGEQQSNLNEKVIETAFQYYNYSFFPKNFDQNGIFFYLYHYNYLKIAKILLENKKDEIEMEIILK